MILADTGPLVAAGNRNDDYHAKCVRALTTAQPPRLVPATVVAETGYLLERAAGPSVAAEFLRLFSAGYLKLADVTDDDLTRAAELVEQYADFPPRHHRCIHRRRGRTAQDHDHRDPRSTALRGRQAQAR